MVRPECNGIAEEQEEERNRKFLEDMTWMPSGDEREGEQTPRGDRSAGEEQESGEDVSSGEEEEEGDEPNIGKDVKAPSKSEWDEHMVTHVPFRDWCPHCVKGRGKRGMTRRRNKMGKEEVPVVSIDYGYMSGRKGNNALGEDSG